MKRFVLSAALAIGSLASTGASAQDLLNTAPSPGRPYGPWYGAVSGGYAMVEDTSGSSEGDTARMNISGGYVLAAAVGYKWPKYLRTELELYYQSNSIDNVKVNGTKYNASGDIQVLDISLNGYHDINTGTKVKPYFGGGVGAAHLMMDNVAVEGVSLGSDNSNRMEVHGEVGFSYQLGHEVTVGPSYRYTHFFSGDGIWDNSNAHQFKLGMRFPFR